MENQDKKNQTCERYKENKARTNHKHSTHTWHRAGIEPGPLSPQQGQVVRSTNQRTGYNLVTATF